MLTRAEGANLEMHAALFSPEGAERTALELVFPAADATGPARLAEALLAAAPEAIRVHFSPA